MIGEGDAALRAAIKMVPHLHVRDRGPPPSRLNTWVIASLPERVKKNTVMVLFGTHDSGHNALQSITVAVPLGMND